jgi:hypothetical protein
MSQILQSQWYLDAIRITACGKKIAVMRATPVAVNDKINGRWYLYWTDDRGGHATNAEIIDNLGFIPMRLCPCPRLRTLTGRSTPNLARFITSKHESTKYNPTLYSNMPRNLPVAARARDQPSQRSCTYHFSSDHNACCFPFSRAYLPLLFLTSTSPPLTYNKPSNQIVPHLHDFDMFSQLPCWLIMFTPEMRGLSFQSLKAT